MACNSDEQRGEITTADPYPREPALVEQQPIDDYWAKDNLDLERVGNLLERSEDPEEFERYLNDDDGINNLDLNGDGYGDYISVEEFGDNDSNSRGLSLFSRFGPNLIQQIATILLHRDSPNYPGARFLINGNEQLYGDNNYYETNWLDRSIPLVSTLFGNHTRYSSPYYYDNYPNGYNSYQVVDTPVYRTRIEQLYPQPVFVYTTNPTFIDKVKIKSPHEGKWINNVYAKLAKPTKEQAEFLKSNPGRKNLAIGDKPGRVDPPRSDRGDERGNPARDERGAQRGNPDKPVGNPKDNGPGGKPEKFDNPNKGGGNPNKGGDKPKMSGGNPNKGGGNPNSMGGGNPNKGGGNPNKGGGKGKP